MQVELVLQALWIKLPLLCKYYPVGPRSLDIHLAMVSLEENLNMSLRNCTESCIQNKLWLYLNNKCLSSAGWADVEVEPKCFATFQKKCARCTCLQPPPPHRSPLSSTTWLLLQNKYLWEDAGSGNCCPLPPPVGLASRRSKAVKEETATIKVCVILFQTF